MTDLNTTTCVKCGTEGPHTMTLRHTFDNIDPGTFAGCGFEIAKELEEMAREWISVTCVGCGYSMGTMPCKDAKEDV